jgi:hypothetical protein
MAQLEGRLAGVAHAGKTLIPIFSSLNLPKEAGIRQRVLTAGGCLH